MKCFICRRPLASGADMNRRAEYRLQRDGSIKVFGHGMPDGELSQVTGSPVKVVHNGCYHAARKHEQRAG